MEYLPLVRILEELDPIDFVKLVRESNEDIEKFATESLLGKLAGMERVGYKFTVHSSVQVVDEKLIKHVVTNMLINGILSQTDDWLQRFVETSGLLSKETSCLLWESDSI